jgi:hypothetical protein
VIREVMARLTEATAVRIIPKLRELLHFVGACTNEIERIELRDRIVLPRVRARDRRGHGLPGIKRFVEPVGGKEDTTGEDAGVGKNA